MNDDDEGAQECDLSKEYRGIYTAATLKSASKARQAEFKMSLIVGINSLIIDVEYFRKNFEKNGPSLPGIETKEIKLLDKLYSLIQGQGYH